MVKKADLRGMLVAFVLVGALVTTLCANQVHAGSFPASTQRPVAEVSQRVETDRLEVRVYQGKQLVRLGRFMELFIVTPLDGRPQTIENLVGRTVAIVPSEKRPDRWEVYVLRSVASLGHQGLLEAFYEPAQQHVRIRTDKTQMLVENIFKVNQVFVSSGRRPVELKLDGQVIRLKPGDALLVL